MKIHARIVFLMVTFLCVSCNKNQDKIQEDVKNLDGWFSGGNKEAGYEIGAESEKYNGKPVFYLKANSNAKDNFGTIVKNFNPSEYMGKRIRLSGYVKSDKIYGWAGLWLRIDGGLGEGPYGKTLCFDNMEKRPIKETTEWAKYEIVTDVPRDSRMLFYGALLRGYGELWISDLEFETVGTEVPLTTWISEKPFPW